MLPILAFLIAAPSAAHAATEFSSPASQLHGWLVQPTSWYYSVGQYFGAGRLN
jgi:hypothetical protein